ncbi:MAG: hypothetical protein IPM38_15370 [Ignavibacteria bacterium]|nr:hypothetical protein [Ignavibacteria bacterium]
MKKSLPAIIFSCLFIFLITGTAFPANEYFRSIVSGNWNATSTWQMSTNSGFSWIAATLTPNENSGVITVRYPNTVTVTANVSADQLTIDSGTVSINAGIILTLLEGSGTDLTVLKGGTVTGAGIFRTQGSSMLMDLKSGSSFNAALKVNTGSVTIAEVSSPYDGRLFGSVTVDAGATLDSYSSGSYVLFIYGNLINNGTMTGSGSNVKFYGASLTNNGSIQTPNFNFDSTSTVSGAGTWTGTNIFVGSNGNVSLLNNVTFSPVTKFSISTGGTFSANAFTATYTTGMIEILTGGTVANSGTIRTQGTIFLNPRSGSSFNANLNVFSGTTTAAENASPYNGRLYGNVTVSNGATLDSYSSGSFELYIYGNLINNGTMTGSGSQVKFYGASLTNSGSIATPNFNFDSTSSVTGAGTWTGGNIFVGNNGNVTLLSNVVFSPSVKFSISTGGTFSANGFIATYTFGMIEILTGGTVANSGTIRTQGNIFLNPRSGSSFNANLNVFSGITTAAENASPYDGRLNGNVTVNAGATLDSYSSGSFTLYIYGNLINNGTMTGSGSNVKFYGASLTNTGSIATPNFNFDSTSTVSGSGTWTGINIFVGSNGNVSLLNNVTFSPSIKFSINTGGTFSANTFIATYTTGMIEILTGGTVSNSGQIRTQGNINLNPRTGSNFNVNLRVISGTTIAAELSSPYNARLYGNITVDAGAILSTYASGAFTLLVYGNLTNNGTISGAGEIEIHSGAHTLQGIGIITSNVYILSGAVVTLLSNHQFKSVTINAGASFDISNRLVKFTLSNPIVQNGTFITAGSDVEYNGTSVQNISYLNIIYVGLKINNPAGTVLLGNIIISDTLQLILGGLNLSGDVITFTPDGYLAESPGNVVYGTSGHMITTRTLGAPSSLNVAGFGAVLTTSTNLGSTEIKRGHTVQTGLNGGTSIKRYYDITPTVNSGLNATLIYKYDDTELNGKPEPSLKLFKSTNSGSTWQVQGGIVNVLTNQITLTGLSSFSRWAADSSGVSALITMVMEAFYNPSNNRLNSSDTVRMYLRNTSSPYAVVDSAKEIVNFITLKSGFKLVTATTGTYYLQMKHRNSIETWSNAGVNYTVGNTMVYDFTTATNKAFGNNQTQVDASPVRFAIYSGDVNQDGTVDIADGGLVDNDASTFVSGYVPTDVNGDSITDIDDAVYVDNNGLNFIGKVTP